MSAGAARPSLVVSCYELGHQPVAVASAIAFLRRAGHPADALDLSVEPIERLDRAVDGIAPPLVALSTPMHTALRIAVRAAERIRRLAPQAHICFFGHYATLNADYLLEATADSVISGEFERPLLELADALRDRRAVRGLTGVRSRGESGTPHLRRVPFAVPDRGSLPAVDRYAKLSVGDRTRQAAAIEASRGCLHACRHCPIPPIYEGRFFVVPREIVRQDVRALVAEGVTHITFADPDFFNGPGHTLGLVRSLHAEFPELTFDLTTKIERILKHRDRLPELAACGVIFIVSAVESLSDEVLTHLAKGHTKAAVFEALGLLRDAGIALRPSLVAFTPWTRIEDYLEILDWVAREGLIEHLDAVQYSIRLLVPPDSLLTGYPAMLRHLRGLEPSRFSHAWEHPDPRMDELQREVAAIVREAATTGERTRRTFERVRDLALRAAGRAEPATTVVLPAREVSPPPRLTEPWFC